jgi:hypothetical protein
MTTVTCAACRLRFAGVSAYAIHRTAEFAPGQRLCLATADLVQIGMTLTAAGSWACASTETQPLAAETAT